MNQCQNCKHWDLTGNRYQIPEGLGCCVRITMLWDAFTWTEEEDKPVFKEEHKYTLAFVQDGSDYKANLYTRPTFGCVMWESKEQTP